jgi:hypothetical protein
MMAPSIITSNYDGQNATGYRCVTGAMQGERWLMRRRWNCPSATVIGYTVQAMGHEWLTAAEGFWDETTKNIQVFFNAHPLGTPTG